MVARGEDRGLRPPLFYRLSAEQLLAIDVVVAVLALVLGLLNAGGGGFGLAPHIRAAPALWLVVGTLPVAVRRVWPLSALALVTVALTVVAAEARSEYVLDVMVALTAYTVATRFERRVTVPALVVVVVALGAGSIVGGPTASDQASAMHSVLFAVSGWCVGESVRWRRAYVAGLRERAAERARVDAERVRAAVREQRVRIARELHDVVAHSLGVITVQAGVGRRLFAERPDQARDALASVEAIGRSASDELRRIVGLLREDEVEPPPLAPAPGLDELPDLVDRVRGAGVPVQLAVLGEPRGVPTAAGLSAYRIVQEALTNVVRHAPGASATVTVEAGGDGVRIRVLNDGAGRTLSGNGTGHGIVGMRERAAAFGGALSAEPRPEGGFEVAAFLPARSG